MIDLSKILGDNPVSYTIHATGGCACSSFLKAGHLDNCLAKKYFIVMSSMGGRLFEFIWHSLN
jgi:hypothetical protein